MLFLSKLFANTCHSLVLFCLPALYLIMIWYTFLRGPGSSVGIATGYRLDGPGIEARWGRDFPHLSRPALRPTQPPVQWVPGLSWGKKRPGRDADPSLPSSAVVKERLGLYIYSSYGPYDLYRASAPVQGCTFFIRSIQYKVEFGFQFNI